MAGWRYQVIEGERDFLVLVAESGLEDAECPLVQVGSLVEVAQFALDQPQPVEVRAGQGVALAQDLLVELESARVALSRLLEVALLPRNHAQVVYIERSLLAKPTQHQNSRTRTHATAHRENILSGDPARKPFR